MRKVISSLLCLYFLVLTGCASRLPEYSREQWLQGTNRFIPDTTIDAVAAATEKTFRLADGSDVKMTHFRNGMKAARWTAPFPTHIWYNWEILFTEKDGGVEIAVVDLNITQHALAVPSGPFPHQSLDVVKLLFSRVEYLLKKSTKWYTCKEFLQENPSVSSLDALCSLADDKVPE